MLTFIASLSPLTRFTLGAIVVAICCALVAYAEVRRSHIAID